LISTKQGLHPDLDRRTSVLKHFPPSLPLGHTVLSAPLIFSFFFLVLPPPSVICLSRVDRKPIAKLRSHRQITNPIPLVTFTTTEVVFISPPLLISGAPTFSTLGVRNSRVLKSLCSPPCSILDVHPPGFRLGDRAVLPPVNPHEIGRLELVPHQAPKLPTDHPFHEIRISSLLLLPFFFEAYLITFLIDFHPPPPLCFVERDNSCREA